jgi:hypothetical protein
LLVLQARPKVHHGIFGGRVREAPCSGAWLVLIHV